MLKGVLQELISAPRDGRRRPERVYPPQLPPAPHIGADQMGARTRVVCEHPSRSDAKRVRRSSSAGTQVMYPERNPDFWVYRAYINS